MSDEENEIEPKEKTEKISPALPTPGEWILSILFKVPLRFGFGFLEFLVEGYILSKMWFWFVFSRFDNVPYISYVDAIGISWVINFALNDIHFSNSISNEAHVDRGIDPLSFNISKSLTKLFLRYPLTYVLAWAWWKYFVLKH